jgi:hypothetical protein
MSAATPLRLAIDRITVSAASGLDARRLADALPGALERALANRASGAVPRSGLPSPAEQAAMQIAAAISERLR